MAQSKLTKTNYRKRFQEIAALADEDIRLDEAALIIAAETDPELEVDFYLSHLDDIASRFKSSLEETSEIGVNATSLVNFIHQTEGFTGNVRDYNDPQNSYLNRVLETRSGIPISLALVHIALGERLNIPVKGIKFPLRFLIQYGDETKLIIDPFTGRILSQADCANLLKQLVNPKAELQQHYFDIATNKDILTRILENLKQLFWKRKSWENSLACIERQILLHPDNEEFRLQLGSVFERQGNLPLAEQTYTGLLQTSNNPKLKGLVSKHLLAMQGNNPTIH